MKDRLNFQVFLTISAVAAVISLLFSIISYIPFLNCLTCLICWLPLALPICGAVYAVIKHNIYADQISSGILVGFLAGLAASIGYNVVFAIVRAFTSLLGLQLAASNYGDVLKQYNIDSSFINPGSVASTILVSVVCGLVIDTAAGALTGLITAAVRKKTV